MIFPIYSRINNDDEEDDDGELTNTPLPPKKTIMNYI